MVYRAAKYLQMHRASIAIQTAWRYTVAPHITPHSWPMFTNRRLADGTRPRSATRRCARLRSQFRLRSGPPACAKWCSRWATITNRTTLSKHRLGDVYYVAHHIISVALREERAHDPAILARLHGAKGGDTVGRREYGIRLWLSIFQSPPQDHQGAIVRAPLHRQETAQEAQGTVAFEGLQ